MSIAARFSIGLCVLGLAAAHGCGSDSAQKGDIGKDGAMQRIELSKELPTKPGNIKPGGDIQAIGPKQDDPATPPKPGDAQAIGPKQDDPATPPKPGDAQAIGPKQDDPATPPKPGDAQAIGPKQDDPATPPVVSDAKKSVTPTQPVPKPM